MPYDELGNFIQGDEPSVDQMRYELAKRGSMPLRSQSDVPFVASEVPSVQVPSQPKEVRPASSSTNIVQALVDKFGITAIPQSILSLGSSIGSIPISSAYGVYKGVTSPNFGTQAGVQEGSQAAKRLQQEMTYQPTSAMAQDILAGVEQIPKIITGSDLPLPPLTGLGGQRIGISPTDIRVMGANAKRVAGEVGDIRTDFANAQSGIRRENAFGEPTLGVKAQEAADALAPVLVPKIEKFQTMTASGPMYMDVGPSAQNWSRSSEDTFKRAFSSSRNSGKTVDEANIEAWKASQLDDVTQGAPGSLGTRYLLPTDKLVQESMTGEPMFKPNSTAVIATMPKLRIFANDYASKNFGTDYGNLTAEQKLQFRDYALSLRTVGKSANLPAALEAYPQIANYSFEYTPTRSEESGGFGRDSKIIKVKSPKTKSGSTTIHELQHAIQQIEGLPQGANTALFDLTTDEGKKYQNYVGKLEDEKEALMHAGFMQKKATENNVPLDEYIKQNNAEIDSLFQKEAKSITSREANVLNRMDELAMKYTPDELETMMVDLQSNIAKNPKNPFKAYEAVFGEAHARNVQLRQKLPFEKRREIFPESTFDVPKEQLRFSTEQADAPSIMLKAEEKPKRQSKAEAVAQGLYHPVGGGVKLKRPISEMDIQTMDNPDMPLVPRKEMKPEDMVGGAIIPLSMDLSSAGKIITSVGGNKLVVPVKTQGGYEFMQWNGDSWSSLPNVSKRIGSQIQKASKMEGVDPDKIFGVTKTMSPTAVDFNHMTTEVLLNQFDPTTIPKPIAKEFNTLVRDQGIKNQKTGIITYPFKTFEGIQTPEGRVQLLEISNWGGELRKNMINKMSLKDFREAGFPDVAEARAAVSAPELLDQPIGMTGHGITRFNPSGELNLDPADPHYTYTANIKGHPTKGAYAGAFQTPISNEVTFKPYFDERRALNKSKASDDRAFSMSMPIQKTNQEWLDSVMAEIEAQDRAFKEGLSMDEARLAIMRKEEEPKQLSPKDELGFYSNVEKAALNLKRQSGNGQAYMNDIKKQAGVHADELEAIGLSKFLESKKTFTTPEVQDFIANNRLNLIETRFSTDGEDYYNNLTAKILDEQGIDIDYAPMDIRNEAAAKARQIMGEGRAGEVLESLDALSENKVLYGADTYPEYMTPGGQNYRELILQSPERKTTFEPYDITGHYVETLGSDPYTGQRSIKLFNENGSPLGQRYGFRGTDKEALEAYKATQDKLAKEDAIAQSNFTGSHYANYPNIVLNMRLQDFRDVEGKRGTLIDELQSDWHQKGREQGYQLAQKMDGSTGKGVPNAPYKERWHELGIKKAVIDSIKRGDDRIYLLEGKDIAERYNLSKQVNSITAYPETDGKFLLKVKLKNGHVMPIKRYAKEELSDVIGKDLAKKIVESDGGKFEGLDLSVGGEGMKKYYDEVYPAVFKKLAKQYGGKFGETEISIGDKATLKVRYYEPDEEAKVKIQGGIAMKDGGAVHMREGGDPATAREALFEANRKALAEKQAIEQATRPRTYAERLNDMYDSGQLKRPNVRPSGGAGIVPSIEPSGSGSPSLLNPLNRKNGGDVNLDAMRYALTKGK